MAIINKLKSFRHKHELNQKSFAEFLNLTHTDYNRFENNKRQPSLEQALLISKKLETSIHEIFQLTET